MPHMANLSWLPLFVLFNSVLLMIFISLNFSYVSAPSMKSLVQTTDKKWQW